MWSSVGMGVLRTSNDLRGVLKELRGLDRKGLVIISDELRFGNH